MESDSEPRLSLTQIIGYMKSSSARSVSFGPCEGGWYKAWKDDKGRVWLEFRKDSEKEKFPVTVELVFDPKNPKVKVSKYNKCTYNRVKKMKSTLSQSAHR